MDSLDISVIVPVYNTENYISICVDSILAQTFTNFELILVDDGSTDNCSTICDEYAKKESRIKVIHQVNAGQAVARNEALDIAMGRYVCFVDSDDAIHPMMLEVMYDMSEKCNADISVCCCTESETLEVTLTPKIEKSENQDIRVYHGNKEILKNIYREGQKKYWVVCAKLFRKELFKSCRFEAGRIYEDNEIVCKLLWKCNTVADCDLPLYFYRKNPNGTTGSKYSERKIDELWAAERRVAFFQGIGYEEFERISRKTYLGLLKSHYEQSEKNFPYIHKRVKEKLKKQLKTVKKLYGWKLSDLVVFYEIIYPKRMQLYWQWQGIKYKLKGK